jgi:hypothetical protein
MNSWRALEKSRGSIAMPPDTQASRVVRKRFSRKNLSAAPRSSTRHTSE